MKFTLLFIAIAIVALMPSTEGHKDVKRGNMERKGTELFDLLDRDVHDDKNKHDSKRGIMGRQAEEEAGDSDLYRKGILDRGLVDRGILDRDIKDRGILDRGIVDRGIKDRGILDRGILDRDIHDKRILKRGF